MTHLSSIPSTLAVTSVAAHPYSIAGNLMVHKPIGIQSHERRASDAIRVRPPRPEQTAAATSPWIEGTTFRNEELRSSHVRPVLCDKALKSIRPELFRRRAYSVRAGESTLGSGREIRIHFWKDNAICQGIGNVPDPLLLSALWSFAVGNDGLRSPSVGDFVVGRETACSTHHVAMGHMSRP